MISSAFRSGGGAREVEEEKDEEEEYGDTPAGRLTQSLLMQTASHRASTNRRRQDSREYRFVSLSFWFWTLVKFDHFTLYSVAEFCRVNVKLHLIVFCNWPKNNHVHYIIVIVSVLSTQINLKQWSLTFSYDYYYLKWNPCGLFWPNIGGQTS